MRDEIEFRKSWLDEWPGQASLIEPSIGSTAGIPDAHLIDDDFPPGWVEFKALDRHGLFKWEPSQRAWTREHLRYSSRVAIVILYKNWWRALHPALLLRLPAQRAYSLGDGGNPQCHRYTGGDMGSILEAVYASQR